MQESNEATGLILSTLLYMTAAQRSVLSLKTILTKEGLTISNAIAIVNA
ncbi:MAG: hypothetical protein KME59_26115 [Trichormus sp. ATA11-4-KO1]|jgi:hypothetical protein|nr:hypothetical protein [Trichormus sp. ATA11-4-KO1]